MRVPNIFIVALFVGTMASRSAHAIDIAPGDYTILPADTRAGLIYLQASHADHLRFDDGREIASSELDTGIALLRGLYYSEIGSMPVAYQAFLPFGKLYPKIGNANPPVSDGIGDLTLGFTFWPVQPQGQTRGTTLGITLYLTAPTGHFNQDDVSLGQGTWSFTSQIGLIQDFGNGWFFDGALDATVYRSFEDDGLSLSKEPVYQFQAYVRKAITAKTNVSVGYSGIRGGSTSTNSVTTGLRNDSDQIRFFASHFLNDALQLQAAVFRDIDFDGGFGRTTTVQLRLLTLF